LLVPMMRTRMRKWRKWRLLCESQAALRYTFKKISLYASFLRRIGVGGKFLIRISCLRTIGPRA
jgi:hypothetical protein